MMIKLRRFIVFTFTGFILAVSATLQATVNLPDFTEMVEQFSPAVVNISTLSNQKKSLSEINPKKFSIPDLEDEHPLNELLQKFLGEQFEQFDVPELFDFDKDSLGSGFIISADGYILTNHHVVSNGDEIIVRLNDRREFKAQLIGSDKASDIALIKIDAGNLPVVSLGRSADLKVGEWVLAIGSPFGFDHTVTAGIVSAKGRNLPNENYVPFIQTDVAINPGNSGGPLFNLKGEVIGVNSQIYSRSGGFMGLSFAIPIDLAMDVVSQLKSSGKVERGYLGVLIQDVTQELAESFGMQTPAGALVAQVLADSPAAQAGLQAGDVITRFNGITIKRSSQLPPVVGTSPVNKPAKVEILRNGKSMIFDVSVRQLPGEELVAGKPALKQPGSLQSDRVGLIVEGIDDSMIETLSLQISEGVIVTAVQAGAAKLAGIQENDVISMINNRKIRSLQDYRQTLRRAEAGKTLAFLVQRENGALFIPVRIPLK